MLNLDLHLTNGLNVQGIINANKGRSSITAYTDGININNNILGRSSIYINGQDNQYNCLIQTNKDVKGKDMKLVANLQSKDSLLHTQIACLRPVVAHLIVLLASMTAKGFPPLLKST